jgi:predicted nucleotidyltransferase
VIGALAFPHHGYARATLDVDVFIDATPENAARCLAALADFAFDVTDLTVEDLTRYKVLIRQYVIQVDLHPFVAGAQFEDVFQRSEASTIGEVPVRVPCLDDLIAMKVAAGRPKDLEDLKYLTQLRGAKAT